MGRDGRRLVIPVCHNVWVSERTRLELATPNSNAKDRIAGCEWLHIDFDDELKNFYFGACGFVPTNAGLIRS